MYRFQKYGVWVVLGNLFRNWPFRGTVVRLVCIANKQKKTILENYQFMNDSTEIRKKNFSVFEIAAFSQCPSFQVSLVDAFETEKMCLLKFDALPGTDVVTYLAEKSMYSEQLVAEITLQILDALDYIQWRGRVYLNLEPSNVLVCSGRSLGKTVQVKLANFETTQTVSKSGTQIKGTYNFDYAGN